MKRYLNKALLDDIRQKIVLLTGPRQCGKTTLSLMLEPDHQYLNYDLAEHRLLIAEKSWDRNRSLIIFDELHKMDKWKSWLKGIYDVEGIPPGLMVTGSGSCPPSGKPVTRLPAGIFNSGCTRWISRKPPKTRT